jgi:hypothetical protein
MYENPAAATGQRPSAVPYEAGIYDPWPGCSYAARLPPSVIGASTTSSGVSA